MKKFKRIVGFILLTAMLFSAVSCGNVVNPGGETETQAPEEPPKYVLTLADLGNNVEIHTDLQAKYLKDTYDSVGKYIPDIETERSLPKEIELTWSVHDNVNDQDFVPYITYKLTVATKSDFSDAKEYKTKEEYYTLGNLYIGTTYYWKVSFEKDGETFESDVAAFTTTSQGPRNVKIDGVTNSRDLGGWTTVDGKRVKQGMLYRTAKLSKTTKEYVTAAGKKTMLEELGIRSELDLRGTNADLGTSKEIREESVLKGVKLFNYGFTSSDREVVEKQLPYIFNALADENNYPLFFHCAIGTDRTGIVAYLILAVLGVSEEDIYRDYCFSNFGNIKSGDDNTVRIPKDRLEAEGKVAALVKASAGSTLQEKARNYLLSINNPGEEIPRITEEMLDSMVSIMLED